jgi:transaldolase
MHLDDQMANDKLKEGIDGFAKAISDLEASLAPRLATV